VSLQDIDGVLLVFLASQKVVVRGVERHAGSQFQCYPTHCLGDADLWFDKPAIRANIGEVIGVLRAEGRRHLHAGSHANILLVIGEPL
jgi:hypothetical protein